MLIKKIAMRNKLKNRNNEEEPDRKALSKEYDLLGEQNVLHLIAPYPHPKLLEYFLSIKEIDVNKKSCYGSTPLNEYIEFVEEYHGSRKIGNQVLEALLKAGADPNIPNNKEQYPIISAIQLRKLFCLEILAKYKANLNVVNYEGDSPLVICVKRKQLKNTEILLKSGADPNFKDQMDRTPLHFALNSSKATADASFEMESILIQHGADINAIDKRKRTPLHYAFIKFGNPFSISQADPVETVTSYCSKDNCNVNIVDDQGNTPLHYAAQRGAQISALTLVKKGADVSIKNNDGNTPLAVALKCGH
mmetsp:Transcript_41579/g.36950  ORF Transcript_41579/g.36950 Transcript_41579/m.36950 type:complete len:306 (+) Transcript_41579:3536-4453(+)